MQWYPFTFYQSKATFDPHHNIRSTKEEIFRHIMDIEDYWANAENEFDIKKKMYSRLLVI